jgi:hypothetical protein
MKAIKLAIIAMTTCDASLAPLMAASSTESNFLKWSLPTLCNSQTCSYIVIFWILSFVTSTSSTSGYINLLKQRAAGAVITQDVTRWAGLAPEGNVRGQDGTWGTTNNKKKGLLGAVVPDTDANPDVMIEWTSESVRWSRYGFNKKGDSL